MSPDDDGPYLNDRGELTHVDIAVRLDEADYIGDERCPVCGHLDVLHLNDELGRWCEVGECDTNDCHVPMRTRTT